MLASAHRQVASNHRFPVGIFECKDRSDAAVVQAGRGISLRVGTAPCARHRAQILRAGLQAQVTQIWSPYRHKHGAAWNFACCSVRQELPEAISPLVQMDVVDDVFPELGLFGSSSHAPADKHLHGTPEGELRIYRFFGAACLQVRASNSGRLVTSYRG